MSVQVTFDPDDSHFGECPECGRHDGYRNVGRSHWFFCRAHMARWCVGANLFSSWRHETEAEQRQAYEDVGLALMRDVDPVHEGAVIRELQAACPPSDEWITRRAARCTSPRERRETHEQAMREMHEIFGNDLPVLSAHERTIAVRQPHRWAGRRDRCVVA